MSWLCFVLLLYTGTSASNDSYVTKGPIIIHAEEGESVNIICEFSHSNIEGLYLKRTVIEQMDLLYAAKHGAIMTNHAVYEKRIAYLEQKNSATITLLQVQINDSDVYVCEGTLLIDLEPTTMNSSPTILAVKAKSTCPSSSWVWYVLIFQALVLVLAMVFILFRTNIKKCKKYWKKRKGNETQNMVYEDMSYSLKRNRMNMPNLYQS